MCSTKVKAVGLLSGGLDSTLAAKLLLEQAIEVHAINFSSPFCTCTPKNDGCPAVVTAVKALGNITLRRVALRDEYLEMVRKPKHGYGTGMNPCIDCRIMKIKKAGEYMHSIGASFLFTGEVLGQRPMSQHRQAIDIIDREAGMSGNILRPLSASHFEPTIPEQKGWVVREKLLGISGRSRKTQMALAATKGIQNYPCPAGGCLLTDKHFAAKMRDYFRFATELSMKDIALIKIGRHFRLKNGDKIIVARNAHECIQLKHLSRDHDHLLIPYDFKGPTVILNGDLLEPAVEKMIQYTKHPDPKATRVIHRHQNRDKIVFLSEIGKCSGR